MSRRGGKKSHKGGRKQFTNPDEIDAQMKREMERQKRREEVGDDSEEEEEVSSKMRQPNRDFPPSSSEESSEEEESSDDEGKKNKGVSHLIEVQNPNRVQNKMKKARDLDVNAASGQQLSRREREELQKQQERTRYRQLQLEGKTHEAQADLARLAIIKKNREDAARKKEQEKQAKDAKDRRK